MAKSPQHTAEALKKMRANQAGILTKQINKGKKGMDDGRSKRHLTECMENISHAIDTVKESNVIYSTSSLLRKKSRMHTSGGRRERMLV